MSDTNLTKNNQKEIIMKTLLSAILGLSLISAMALAGEAKKKNNKKKGGKTEMSAPATTPATDTATPPAGETPKH